MMEILKHGSEVEVLEPKWLRDKVIKEINAAGLQYLPPNQTSQNRS